MTTKIPKCEKHQKELDTIYPDKDIRLCKFRCGCIIKKVQVPKQFEKLFEMMDFQNKQKSKFYKFSKNNEVK